MNKNIIVIGIVVLFLVVGLSGCTETELNESDESENIDDGINNSPKVSDVYASSTNVEVGESIDFSCDVIDYDGEIVSYYWDFGDGTISSLKNPSHIYKNSGLYSVWVKPIDNDGGEGWGDISIRVDDIAPDPEIIDHNSYTRNIDFVYIIGIIKNVASVCINNVEIKAVLYDSAGNVIKTSLKYNPYTDEYYYSWARPTIIESGDTGCFKITFQDVPYYDHYGLEIYSYRTDFNEGYDDSLVLENVEGGLEDYDFGSDYYNVVGIIRNTGSNAYLNVNVHGIFYDSIGKIIAVEYDMIGEGFPFTLYAGQEESLFIQISDWEMDISQISDYELKIEYSKYW